MKKTAKVAAGLLPFALLLTACGGGGTSSESGSAGGGGQMIGYAQPIGSQPGQQQIATGMEAASAEVGWDTKVIDANLSVDKQVSDLQTMMQLGVDTIALWALDDDALRSAYAQAQSQDVKLIGMNTTSDEFAGSVWWEASTCEAGGPSEETANYIADRKPDAKVIVIGGPPVTSVMNMTKCFEDAVKAAGLEVVNRTDNTNDDSASAATIMSDLLLKYPDVDAVWAYNDASALGASSAITQSGGAISDGTNDGTIVVGVNADADAVDAVEQGRLTGTWDPNPPASGWALVKAAQLAADGEPADLVVKATFWSKENIGEYVKPEDREFALDSIPLVD